jgi:hypothetical protein
LASGLTDTFIRQEKPRSELIHKMINKQPQDAVLGLFYLVATDVGRG